MITPSAGEKKNSSSAYIGRLGSRKKYSSAIHFSGFSLAGTTSASTHSFRLFAMRGASDACVATWARSGRKGYAPGDATGPERGRGRCVRDTSHNDRQTS